MKYKKKNRRDLLTFEVSPADPFGSYTGRSKDGEKPVQDADDL
jgi:hypothetical protein